jgi:hypothetical protein
MFPVNAKIKGDKFEPGIINCNWGRIGAKIFYLGYKI